MISWLIKTEVWGITDMLFDKSWYHAKTDLNICFIMHDIQPFKVSKVWEHYMDKGIENHADFKLYMINAISAADIGFYQKLDHWTMQFKSFHWLNYHRLWAIILCTFIRQVKPKVILYIVAFYLLLKNNVVKIYLYFRAFLVKQLFHLHLLDMRWL